MIRIEINGRVVETTQSGVIELDLVNPHLTYETIQRSAIKAPVFPGTARNHAVFGHVYEPTSVSGFGEYSWKHYLDGDLIREGFFRLNEASKAGYSGEFDDRLDQFFGEWHFKNLDELPLGSLPLSLPAGGVVVESGMDAYALPTVLNSDYFGTNPATYTGAMNDYASGSYLSDSPKVPMFFVPYVCKKIGDLTGVTITGEFLSHPIFSKLLLFNTREAVSTVTIANHLPKMAVIDFFMELRKLPNLKLDFDTVNKKLTIDFWDEALGAAPAFDWSKKAIESEIKKLETKRRLQLQFELDSSDALMKDKPVEVSDYLTPEIVGETNTDFATVKARFSTLLTDAATGLSICKQVGVTEQFGQLTARFSPRLLFWNGMISGKPAATNSHGGYSLFWNGTNGLAEKCWKNTELLRQDQFYLKKNFALTGVDLARLDFSKKIHVAGVNYLLAAIQITNPIKGVAQCLLVGGKNF